MAGGWLISWLVSGCTVLGTLQTPDVLKPGSAVFGTGLTLQAQPVRQTTEEERQEPLLTQTNTWARVGVVPGVDVGVQIAGLFGGFGANAKVQLLRQPVLVALNGGVGLSDVEVCLFGCTRTRIGTKHASLIVGSDRLYGAVQVLQYHFEETTGTPLTGRADRERIIPGLVFGASNARGRVRAIGEVSVHFAGTVTVAMSGGLQFKLTGR